MARPVSKATVNRQDSDIIVKSIDQSKKSCEFLVQSRVQSRSSPVQNPGIVETPLLYLTLDLICNLIIELPH